MSKFQYYSTGEQLIEFKSGDLDIEEKEFNVNDYINSDVEEVVINSCFGGFSLSNKAAKLLAELTGEEVTNYPDIARNNRNLIAVIKSLGNDANGRSAELEVITVEKGCKWYITEYDGIESIELKDQLWLLMYHGKSAVVIADSPSMAIRKVNFPSTAAITSLDEGYYIL